MVQQSRLSDGSRRVTSITEITGVESNTLQMSEIFRFQQKGYDENKKVIGDYIATGIIPDFYSQLRKRGINVDLSIFKPGENND